MGGVDRDGVGGDSSCNTAIPVNVPKFSHVKYYKRRSVTYLLGVFLCSVKIEVLEFFFFFFSFKENSPKGEQVDFLKKKNKVFKSSTGEKQTQSSVVT